jgi:hypothetical protein
MHVLHIYLFHYAQCIVYFIYAIITHCFQTWQDGALVSKARYIEVGQVTKIVIFFTLTLVHEVCKTNKHCFMSLVGSFDPPSQGPRWGHGDGF